MCARACAIRACTTSPCLISLKASCCVWAVRLLVRKTHRQKKSWRETLKSCIMSVQNVQLSERSPRATPKGNYETHPALQVPIVELTPLVSSGGHMDAQPCGRIVQGIGGYQFDDLKLYVPSDLPATPMSPSLNSRRCSKFKLLGIQDFWLTRRLEMMAPYLPCQQTTLAKEIQIR